DAARAHPGEHAPCPVPAAREGRARRDRQPSAHRDARGRAADPRRHGDAHLRHGRGQRCGCDRGRDRARAGHRAVVRAPRLPAYREAHRVTEPQAERRTAELPRGSWRLAVRRAWHGFVRHRGIDAAAALTFFLTLALFPAALAVPSGLSLMGDRERAADDLLAFLGALLPDEIAASLADGVAELLRIENPAIALTAAIVLLLWTASGYATAFGRAVNAVYEVQEGRPFWMFRGRMLLVAALLVLLATGVVLALLATPTVASDVLGRRGLAPVVTTVWVIVRIPLVV